MKLGFIRTIRFIRFLPWLLWQIVLANIDLAIRTLHPKMPINPILINIKNNLKSDLGMVILANSITLTPGTVTIDINENEFLVHVISEKAAIVYALINFIATFAILKFGSEGGLD